MTKYCPPTYLPVTKKLPINPDVPQTLFNEFVEDDPRTVGITVHMNAGDRFQLYHAVRVLTLPVIPMTYVDIGTLEGGSALLIYNALKRSNRPFRGWTVDPNAHPNLSPAQVMFEDKVTYLQATSQEAAKLIKYELKKNKLDDELDFVFVDGRHDWPYPLKDVFDFFPLLRYGGIMMFHDYFPPFVFDVPHEPVWKSYCVYDVCTFLEKFLPIKVLNIPLLSSSWKDPVGYGIPKVYTTMRAWRKIIK